MRWAYQLVGAAGWVAGVVVSKGAWSCFFAIVFFPYAWYLAIEFLMRVNGWIN